MHKVVCVILFPIATIYEIEITDSDLFYQEVNFHTIRMCVFSLNCSENSVALRFLCLDFVVLFVCLKE